MKKGILFFIVSVLLLACSEEEVANYSSSDRIYFNNKSEPDSVIVNLKAADKPVYVDDTIIRIPVRLLGYSSNVDRAFTAEALDASTAVVGRDFEILPSYILADTNSGTLNVKLKNSDLLKGGETLALYLMLRPNEFFDTDYSEDIATNKEYNNLYYKIFFYATVDVEPGLWKDYVRTASYGVSGGLKLYLGEYSLRKFEVFCTATGVPASLFEYTIQDLIDASGSSVVNFANCEKLFESRFGTLANMSSRWYTLIDYYLSTHPEAWDIYWGLPPTLPYNVPNAWGGLNNYK